MARHRTAAHGSSRFTAGTALIGSGMFLLYENLAGAVASLSHAVAPGTSETLRVPSAVMLAVSRILDAYAGDHQCFVRNFLLHMLISSWPLVLVMIGTVLSLERSERGQNNSKKNFVNLSI